MSLLDAVKDLAAKFGIFVSYAPAPGTYARCLRDYLLRMNIDVVLDVGAFVGDYAREIRALGYQGRIISFEPVPESFARLQENMQQDAFWTGQPYGLSEENTTAVINTYSKGNFNSLLHLREDGEAANGLDTSKHGKIHIQLRRLDAVLPSLLEEKPASRVFLKIDTQGHDVSVLRGASGVLNRIWGVQSEMPVVQIYDGMVAMSDALDYYASCGFVPIAFNRVHMLEEIQISPEFDVLLNRFDGKLPNNTSRCAPKPLP